MNRDDLVLHVEAALLSAGRPVAIDEFVAMFEGREDAPDRSAIRDAVAAVAERWHGRAMEVAEVASGYRAQVRKEYSQTISALWQERPARYSRALLETLALIAYRQPVSRGEIEEVRGVGVSSSIMKTLVEREWVRVVGHREVPGRPALFGTTKQFLDAFNLKSLESLPPLAELKELDEPPPDLFAGVAEAPADGTDSDSPGADVAAVAVAADDATDSPGADAAVAADTADDTATSPGADAAVAADTADDATDSLGADAAVAADTVDDAAASPDADTADAADTADNAAALPGADAAAAADTADDAADSPGADAAAAADTADDAAASPDTDVAVAANTTDDAADSPGADAAVAADTADDAPGTDPAPPPIPDAAMPGDERTD